MVQRNQDPHASTTTREVHIIPLGWELDRAVLPFETVNGKPPIYHAHEFHILSEGKEVGKGFPELALERLKRIAPVIPHSVAREDFSTGKLIEFEQIVDVASQICARAIERGDRVHINLSSGSKLIAFAAGVVAMAHIRPATGSVYYVRPERYSLSQDEFQHHGFGIGLDRIQEVTPLPLRLPPIPQLRVLSYLKHQIQTRTSYRDILGFLGEIPGSGYAVPKSPATTIKRRRENANVTRMVRTLISPLEQEGLVRVVPSGVAKLVELTPSGRIYASLSAIDQPGLRKPID
ncbi:MAG: DUF6293 family protein [Thermoplasmata archaeon]|jgi:hypothetical protein